MQEQISLLYQNYDINGLQFINFINCTFDEHIVISSARNTPAVIDSTVSKKKLTFAEQLDYTEKLKTRINAAYWLVKKDIDTVTQGYGVVSLTDINFINKSAMVGYYKIPSIHKGVGIEILKATQLLAFNKLKLDTLYADVEVDNIPSIKSLERAGYKKQKLLNIKIKSIPTIICRYKITLLF